MAMTISVGEALFGIIFILVVLYMINLWRAWRIQRRPSRHQTIRLKNTKVSNNPTPKVGFHIEDDESHPTKSY